MGSLKTDLAFPDVFNSFVNIHPSPVIQHVADATRTENEAHVIFTATNCGAKADTRKIKVCLEQQHSGQGIEMNDGQLENEKSKGQKLV